VSNAVAASVLFYRSDNAIKNHWHSVAKHKPSTEDLIAFDMPALSVSESLLSCTPSQNGGLVGVQPVRLFNTPKSVSYITCFVCFLLFQIFLSLPLYVVLACCSKLACFTMLVVNLNGITFRIADTTCHTHVLVWRCCVAAVIQSQADLQCTHNG